MSVLILIVAIGWGRTVEVVHSTHATMVECRKALPSAPRWHGRYRVVGTECFSQRGENR